MDKPQWVKAWADISFKDADDLNGDLKVVSIYRENGKYWASLPFEVKVTKKTKTGQKIAVDVNVGHFDYPEGQVKTLPNNLKALYKRIKYYQRLLVRKRLVNGKKATQANNYVKMRAKLQRDYRKAANIQHDIVQKFTTMLVNDYDQIAIEDLAVKQM